MWPRMNSSVKFFDPTVICGVEAAPSTGWMTLSPELPVEVGAELLSLLLSLPPPHAARARVASAATSNATTGLVLRRDIVLLVGGGLRPRGVTARCRPAKSTSDASARPATRLAPARRPASP